MTLRGRIDFYRKHTTVNLWSQLRRHCEDLKRCRLGGGPTVVPSHVAISVYSECNRAIKIVLAERAKRGCKAA